MAKKERKIATPNDDLFEWVKEAELPDEGGIYGGIVKLPNGQLATIYMVMGKKDIAILEATTDHLLTTEELEREVTILERTIPLQRYIFEEILPQQYNKKKKKRQ